MNTSRIEVNMNTISGSRRHAVTRPMQQTLHRIAEVVQQEGLSLRTLARRMDITTAQARSELEPQRDLRLSDLCRWKSALRVPVVDLLVHPGTGLSAPINLRARLLKVMKTVRSIQEKSTDEALSRLASRLDDQLTDLMPELKDVASWPAVGQRRTLDELGAIVERVFPESYLGSGPSNKDISE